MVFGWLIRFLVVMLLVRLVWRFVGGVIEGAARGQTQAAPVKGMPLVRDPVCDTYVDQARALTLRRKGETLYFCSEHCRTEFKQRS